MKILSLFVATVTAAVIMGACDRKPAPPPGYPERTVSTAPAPTKPPADAVPRVVVELEKRVEVERELRLKTETRLTQLEIAKSRWQSTALLSISAATALLVVGTILGTRARHDAKK